MKNIFLAFALTTVLITSCSKGNTPVVPPVVTTPTTPVVVADTSLYKFVPFPIGASVGISLMKNNTQYSGIVTKEYNSITVENAMKFDGLHPSQNT